MRACFPESNISESARIWRDFIDWLEGLWIYATVILQGDGYFTIDITRFEKFLAQIIRMEQSSDLLSKITKRSLQQRRCLGDSRVTECSV